MRFRRVHTRRLALLVPLVLIAAFFQTVVLQASPASALTINADDSTADVSATVNGISMKMRVLRPTSGGPYPLVIYRAGIYTGRCANINGASSWMTRAYLAAQGYVVVSYNGRGAPGSYSSTDCSGGAQSSGNNTDVTDGLDDSGYDLAGPNDLADMSGAITWAINGCYDVVLATNKCASAVISDKVGVVGQNMDATTALLLPAYDSKACSCSRLKAVLPVGYADQVRNIKSISSDGAATPAFRQPDLGYGNVTFQSGMGEFGHSDVSVNTNEGSLMSSSYLTKNNYSATINSSSTTLTVSQPPYFSNDDVGKVISIDGAGGSATTTQWTTISGFTSSTQVTLANQATSTVSSSNPRKASWLSNVASRNPTGTISSCTGAVSPYTACYTVAIGSTSYPQFTHADVGQPITIASAIAGSPATTLTTTIAGWTDATHVTLTDRATVDASNVQVRWGAAAWLDQRTVLDDDTSVDKAHLIATSSTLGVFFVNGFLDGSASPLTAIDAFGKITGSDKWLYLGACGASPAVCGTNNGAKIQGMAKDFFEHYLKGVAWTGGGPGGQAGPVYYLVPPTYDDTLSPPRIPDDNWGPSSNGTPVSATAWPPTGSTPATWYACGDGNMNVTTCATTGAPAATRYVMNLNDNDTDSTNSNATDTTIAALLQLDGGQRVGYISNTTDATHNEVISYTTPQLGSDGKMISFTADMFAGSDTSRLQLYFDLFEVRVLNNTHATTTSGSKTVSLNASFGPFFSQPAVGQGISIAGAGAGGATLNSTITAVASDGLSLTMADAAGTTINGTASPFWAEEIPVWQGTSQTVPTARNQAPDPGGASPSPLHFKFKPAGVAWTSKTGCYLRLKVASNQRGAFTPEAVPNKTTIYHNNTTYPFKFTITYV